MSASSGVRVILSLVGVIAYSFWAAEVATNSSALVHAEVPQSHLCADFLNCGDRSNSTRVPVPRRRGCRLVGQVLLLAECEPLEGL